jgi:Apea-like HEPN
VDRERLEQEINTVLMRLDAAIKHGDAHVELENFLREQDTLGLKEQTVWYHPGGGGSLTHTSLSWWLTHRARKVGVVETVKDFLRFEEQKEIEISKFQLFYGFTIENTIKLSEYSKLIPSADLMAEPNAHLLPSEYLNLLQHGQTVLVSHYTLPSIIIDNNVFKGNKGSLEAIQRQKKLYPLELTKNIESILIQSITLIKKIAPIQVFSGSVIAPWVLGSNGFSGGSHSERKPQGRDYPLEEDDIRELKRLVGLFLKLDDNKMERLIVPLRRLLMAKGGVFPSPDHLSKYIDLGIATESLLLENAKNDEITYKICIRAARLLGKTYDERTQIHNVFKALYALRSKAVHAGTDDLSKKERNILKFLEKEDGPSPNTKDKLCKMATNYLIEIAKVTLEQFSLGKEIQWKEVELRDEGMNQPSVKADG